MHLPAPSLFFLMTFNRKQQQLAQQLKAIALTGTAIAINGAFIQAGAEFTAEDWQSAAKAPPQAEQK